MARDESFAQNSAGRRVAIVCDERTATPWWVRAAAVAAQEVLHLAGCSVCLVPWEGAKRYGQHLLRWLRRQGIDGVLDVPAGLVHSWTWRLRRPLPAWKFPLVRVGIEVDNLHADTVIIDRRQEARLALEHLRALGHRRCGYLMTAESGHVQERFRAFQQEAQRLRMWDPALVLDLRDHSREQERVAFAGAQSVLLKQFFRRCGRPMAMFTHNDYAAAPLVEWLLANGYAVGDEVAVIGVDNDPLLVLGDIGLTSVEVPNEDMGRHGARMLLARLRGGTSQRCQRIVLLPRLVVRGSTLSIRQTLPWLRTVLDAMEKHFREPRVVRRLATELRRTMRCRRPGHFVV